MQRVTPGKALATSIAISLFAAVAFTALGVIQRRAGVGFSHICGVLRATAMVALLASWTMSAASAKFAWPTLAFNIKVLVGAWLVVTVPAVVYLVIWAVIFVFG